jgi:hypothetical protein
VKRHSAEAKLRPRDRGGGVRGPARSFVEPRRLLVVTEPQSNLGLEQLRAQVRISGAPRGQEVCADAESFPEFAQDLERWDAGACLDARHVGRGAPLE